MKKVAFLDRDGVINLDIGYIYRWSDFKILEGVIPALKQLANMEYELIVITNQSGIARGFFSEFEYLELTKKIRIHFKKYKINFLDIIHCPHHPNGTIPKYSFECSCRKPKNAMIIEAAEKYDIDLNRSILVGDKLSDIECGERSGIKNNFLINSKYHSQRSYPSLKEIVKTLCKS